MTSTVYKSLSWNGIDEVLDSQEPIVLSPALTAVWVLYWFEGRPTSHQTAYQIRKALRQNYPGYEITDINLSIATRFLVGQGTLSVRLNYENEYTLTSSKDSVRKARKYSFRWQEYMGE